MKGKKLARLILECKRQEIRKRLEECATGKAEKAWLCKLFNVAIYTSEETTKLALELRSMEKKLPKRTIVGSDAYLSLLRGEEALRADDIDLGRLLMALDGAYLNTGNRGEKFIFKKGRAQKRRSALDREIIYACGEFAGKATTAQEVLTHMKNRIGQGVIIEVYDDGSIQWKEDDGKTPIIGFRRLENKLSTIKKTLF